MDNTTHLNWNMRAILDSRGLLRAQVGGMARLHPDIVGQMYDNRPGRASLKSLARLMAVLNVGLAPAPPSSPDAETGATGEQRVPASMTLLRWEGDALVWNLRELRELTREEIRTIFFATAVERTTLSRIDDGRASQASLETLEALALHYGIGLCEAPGNTPTTEYLLLWGPEREEVVEEAEDESPIPGEPSKVCRCPVCTKINPEGVEKRISAFPKSKRYKYGVGSICKAGRREQERGRRRVARDKRLKAAKKARPAKSAPRTPPGT